jgi:hypothetical protein
MANLFDLSAEQRKIMEAIGAGELSPEDAKDTLEGAEGALNDKLIDYCHVHRNLNQQLDTISAELERLTTLKEQKTKEIKNLLRWMLVGLENANIKKLDLGTYKIHTRSGTEQVRILDTNKVPDMYVNCKTTFSPDKRAILKALKAGAEVEGVEKYTTEKSIKII